MQQRLKVVYLDDEPELCELFEDLFASADIEVKTFTDPVRAVEAVQRERPDLFFVDFRLPGTTGIEVAQQVGPGEKYLITGELSVPLQEPFSRVFYKPFPVGEVLALLQDRLKLKRSRVV